MHPELMIAYARTVMSERRRTVAQHTPPPPIRQIALSARQPQRHSLLRTLVDRAARIGTRRARREPRIS